MFKKLLSTFFCLILLFVLVQPSAFADNLGVIRIQGPGTFDTSSSVSSGSASSSGATSSLGSSLWDLPPASFLNNANTSVSVLGSLFDPMVSQMLGANQSNQSNPSLLTRMLNHLDTIMLSGIAIFFVAWFVYGTVKTSEEGMFMGRNQDKAGMAFRMTAGPFLLVPCITKAKICLTQYALMWMILVGVHLANFVWSKTVTDIQGGAIPEKPPALQASLAQMAGEFYAWNKVSEDVQRLEITSGEHLYTGVSKPMPITDFPNLQSPFASGSITSGYDTSAIKVPASAWQLQKKPDWGDIYDQLGYASDPSCMNVTTLGEDPKFAHDIGLGDYHFWSNLKTIPTTVSNHFAEELGGQWHIQSINTAPDVATDTSPFINVESFAGNGLNLPNAYGSFEDCDDAGYCNTWEVVKYSPPGCVGYSKIQLYGDSSGTLDYLGKAAVQTTVSLNIKGRVKDKIKNAISSGTQINNKLSNLSNGINLLSGVSGADKNSPDFTPFINWAYSLYKPSAEHSTDQIPGTGQWATDNNGFLVNSSGEEIVPADFCNTLNNLSSTDKTNFINALGLAGTTANISFDCSNIKTLKQHPSVITGMKINVAGNLIPFGIPQEASLHNAFKIFNKQNYTTFSGALTNICSSNSKGPCVWVPKASYTGADSSWWTIGQSYLGLNQMLNDNLNSMVDSINSGVSKTGLASGIQKYKDAFSSGSFIYNTTGTLSFWLKSNVNPKPVPTTDPQYYNSTTHWYIKLHSAKELSMWYDDTFICDGRPFHSTRTDIPNVACDPSAPYNTDFSLNDNYDPCDADLGVKGVNGKKHSCCDNSQSATEVASTIHSESEYSWLFGSSHAIAADPFSKTTYTCKTGTVNGYIVGGNTGNGTSMTGCTITAQPPSPVEFNYTNSSADAIATAQATTPLSKSYLLLALENKGWGVDTSSGAQEQQQKDANNTILLNEVNSLPDRLSLPLQYLALYSRLTGMAKGARPLSSPMTSDNYAKFLSGVKTIMNTYKANGLVQENFGSSPSYDPLPRIQNGLSEIFSHISPEDSYGAANGSAGVQFIDPKLIFNSLKTLYSFGVSSSGPASGSDLIGQQYNFVAKIQQLGVQMVGSTVSTLESIGSSYTHVMNDNIAAIQGQVQMLSGVSGPMPEPKFPATGGATGNTTLDTLINMLPGGNSVEEINALNKLQDINKDQEKFLKYQADNQDRMLHNIKIQVSLQQMMYQMTVNFTKSMMLLPLAFMVMTMIFTLGITFAIVIPVTPYIYFWAGKTSWLINTIEAMVAAPLVACALLVPEGHSYWGHTLPALRMLWNVVFKPVLLVIGTLVSMMLIYIIIAYSAEGFHMIANGIMGAFPSAGNVDPRSSMDTQAILCLMVMTLYGTFLAIAFTKCFSTIYLIPEKVVQWLGGQSDQFGKEDMQQMSQAASQNSQQVAQAGQQATQNVAGGAKEISSAKGQEGSQEAGLQNQEIGNRNEQAGNYSQQEGNDGQQISNNQSQRNAIKNDATNTLKLLKSGADMMG